VKAGGNIKKTWRQLENNDGERKAVMAWRQLISVMAASCESENETSVMAANDSMKAAA